MENTKQKRMKTGAASQYLGITRRTLTNWASAGRIPYYRLGTRTTIFNRDDLDAFLEKHRVD